MSLSSVLQQFNPTAYFNMIETEEGRAYSVEDLEAVFKFLDNSGLIKSYTLLPYRLKEEYPGIVNGRALAIFYCRTYPLRYPI